MITKGVENSIILICKNFQDAKVLSVSGNLCIDKKPSAINWIEGK
jgi:hydroxymethylglutaryl-CoA reductase (NADPH)